MSKCEAVNRFAQPGQRHRWSVIRAISLNGRALELYRFCINYCGAQQTGTQIPAGVRRQYDLETKHGARR